MTAKQTPLNDKGASAGFLPLLTEGITAITAAIVTGDANAEAAWRQFSERLREADPSRSALTALLDRCELDEFSLKCVVLALAHHLSPATTPPSEPTTTAQVLPCLCPDDASRMAAHEALGAAGALARHRIIAPPTDPGQRLTAPLVLSEEALRFLVGEVELGASLSTIAALSTPRVSMLSVILDPRDLNRARKLITSHPRYRRIVSEWGLAEFLPYQRGVAILLYGPSGTGKSLLAEALASEVGRPLITVNAFDLPTEGLESLLSRLFAAATMRDAIVVFDGCDAVLSASDPRRATTVRAIARHEGITLLIATERRALHASIDSLVAYHVRFELPSEDKRRQIWEAHLPPDVPLDDSVDLAALASTYDFSGAAIKNAVVVAISQALSASTRAPQVTMAHLEEGCRMQLGSSLQELTVQSTNPLRLEDVVLDDEAHAKVLEIMHAIRLQSVVMNEWGFGERLVTGKGITVLLDGPPGTGKTLCAEVIGREFNTPIHRVNLPEIVSKWVGETEKHIQEVFQAARISHAMLLFDEADALFAARSTEPKSATDRYANMEVNLLLQEIERFPGVCILTTNSFGALDAALVRRIQFRVTLLQPDEAQRERIWRVLCPTRLPLAADVDFGELAEEYEMTGGLIKNVFLRAAYRAAREGSAVTQEMLHHSCRAEYVAAGRLTRDLDYVESKRGR